MDIICNIVMMILAADLTGTILALAWLAMFKYFDKYLRADVINFSLKCVIISFYVPSMFIILMIKSYFFGGTESYYSNYTNLMRVLSLLILIVFIYKLVRELIKWFKETKRLKEVILFETRVDDEDELRVVDEVKKKLRIKRRFKVFVAMGIGSPFIYGFFNPKIYLTIEKFDEEKLKMILTHEMYHYKQKDPFMKPLSGIMCCMHWFNPLAKKIRDYYSNFAEVGCDYKCIRKAGYSAEDYFDCMLRCSREAYAYMTKLISMAGTKNGVIERAKLAVKYTLCNKKTSILSLILAVSVLVSSTAVYAATGITESVFDFVFINSSKQVKEKNVVCDDGFTEYYIYENDDGIIVEKSSIELECRDHKSSGSITGEIKNDNNKHLFFRLKDINSSEKIVVSVNCDSFESYENEAGLELGIIEPDGVIRYIEGVSMIYHTFEITKPGDYQVYIVNKSNDKIAIVSSVNYYPREEE